MARSKKDDLELSVSIARLEERLGAVHTDVSELKDNIKVMGSKMDAVCEKYDGQLSKVKNEINGINVKIASIAAVATILINLVFAFASGLINSFIGGK